MSAGDKVEGVEGVFGAELKSDGPFEVSCRDSWATEGPGSVSEVEPLLLGIPAESGGDDNGLDGIGKGKVGRSGFEPSSHRLP